MTVLSESTPSPTPARYDDAAPIPLSRLVKVELRKLVDTRAGFWLTSSIALIAVVVMVVMLIVGRNEPQDLTFSNFFGMMNVPTGIILPIMAILLVTGEWSQRNALTTFTMEPRRERVVLAKLGAAMLAAVGAVAVALILGAVGNVIADVAIGGAAGSWSFSAVGLFNAFLMQILGLLLGFGFAALILNTPGAVVAYFALPTVLGLVSQLVPAFGERFGDWVDLNQTQAPFASDSWASGGEWTRLLVSSLIWIGIPLALGIVRILRAEVK